MKDKLKFLLLKFYFIINSIPFNNFFLLRNTKIINEGAVLINCKIVSKGNNTIIFKKGTIIRNSTFRIYGNKNVVKIGGQVHMNKASICTEDSNNSIDIGNSTNFCGKIHIACTEGKLIKIGNDCLFSSEIVIRSGDSHSIVNMSGKRINPASDVVINHRVWVGHRVLINKGVTIPSNTVVGTGSIVTKPFEKENTIIAGVPAKVVKENINWLIERI